MKRKKITGKKIPKAEFGHRGYNSNGPPIPGGDYQFGGNVVTGQTKWEIMEDGGAVSQMGYRDDSPYRNSPSLDIHTPTGQIDMSETGVPILANGRVLPPYSGTHQFKPGVVKEIRMAQTGGSVNPPIITHDPRQVKAYQDSLYNYQFSQDKLKSGYTPLSVYKKGELDRLKSTTGELPYGVLSGPDLGINNHAGNFPLPQQPYQYQPSMVHDQEKTGEEPLGKPIHNAAGWTIGYEPIKKRLDLNLPTLQSKGFEPQNIPLQEPQKVPLPYFTREPQDQERGHTEYFDKKTGKKLQLGGRLPKAQNGYNWSTEQQPATPKVGSTENINTTNIPSVTTTPRQDIVGLNLRALHTGDTNLMKDALELDAMKVGEKFSNTQTYKDAAYKVGSQKFNQQGTSPFREGSLHDIYQGVDAEKFGNEKADPYKGTLSYRDTSGRDFLKNYIYGDTKGFQKNDLKPIRLDKYQQKYGNIPSYDMNLDKNRESITAQSAFANNTLDYGKDFKNGNFNKKQLDSLFAAHNDTIPLVYDKYSDDPLPVTDDITGHMGYLMRDKKTGDTNFRSQDIWKFDPDDYTKRWNPDSQTKPYGDEYVDTYVDLQNAKKKEQVGLMGKAGHPFITSKQVPVSAMHNRGEFFTDPLKGMIYDARDGKYHNKSEYNIENNKATLKGEDIGNIGKKKFGGKIKPSLKKKDKWSILDEAEEGKLISADEFRPKSLANSNSQIEQQAQQQADIKRVQQNRDPRDLKKDEGNITLPTNKGIWNKLEHPIQSINPKQGGQPLDYALGLPAQIIGAIGRTAENLFSPQTYKDIPKAIASGAINAAGEQAPQEWNKAGLRTLGRIGDASVAIPLLAETKPIAGNLLREQIYKGIHPAGYGAVDKLGNFPLEWAKNTFAKDETDRALKIGSNLSPIMSDISGDDMLRMGQNRLDAFRVGLKLPQKYNTFGKNPDGSYSIQRMKPTTEHLASVYTDKMASDINKMGYYTGDNPLKSIAEDYAKVTSPKINAPGTRDFSLYDMERYLRKSEGKPFELAPWEQKRIVEPSKNPDFSHSVYDNDPNGIMGQFRWDVKREPFGDIHFQSNDTWNLNPFEKRGNSLTKDVPSLRAHYFKPLQNLEALKLVGGEPFDIKNNFIVDPKTYEIKKRFKVGGKIGKSQKNSVTWSIE